MEILEMKLLSKIRNDIAKFLEREIKEAERMGKECIGKEGKDYFRGKLSALRAVEQALLYGEI